MIFLAQRRRKGHMGLTRWRPLAGAQKNLPDTFSFVLATRNRRDALMETLNRLQALRGEAGPHEILVVDNRSIDGTADAVRQQFPHVRVIELRDNLGSCAKAVGVARTRGEFVVFLDDDSYPRPGSLTAMIRRFRADEKLGAAGFTVHLPDGRREGAALPGVFVGCGVGFRRKALRAAGGLDRTLFMQAEEYDLGFRLLRAGWRIDVFDDLHVDHIKTTRARLSGRTVYYDTRNNLLVAARYLPDAFVRPLMRDYTERYRWIADAARQVRSYQRGRLHGWHLAAEERRRHAGWRLNARAFESLFHFERIETHMRELASSGVRRIALADLGKNIYPFVRGARRSGIEVAAIGDDRFAAPGRRYRHIPILPLTAMLAAQPQTIVIANTAPVHATVTARRLAPLAHVPVLQWFGGEKAG